MAAHSGQGATLAGTGLGALLCFVGQINSSDLIKTMLLSITGAVISFAVSVILKWMARRVRGRK